MKVLKTCTVLMGMLAALALISGPAQAYLITFDNLTPGTAIDGVNLGGVTFSSPLPATTVVVNDFGVGWRSPFNAITNFGPGGDFLETYPLTITFDVPQSSISLTGGDKGGDFDQFTVTAFDVNNVQIGQFITPVFGGNASNGNGSMADFYTVNLNFAGIKSVVVLSIGAEAGIGIDNVQFCEVPVPPSLLLLGSGLVGLLGWRRRIT